MVELIEIDSYFKMYIRLSDFNCYLFYHICDNEDINYNKRYLDKYNFYPCLESFTEMIDDVLVSDGDLDFCDEDKDKLIDNYKLLLRKAKLNILHKNT